MTIASQLQKEVVKAMIMSRPQFVLIYGLEEELPGDATREEAIEWIEREGGFDRDEDGNWSNPAAAFFPPARLSPLP